jgi:deazaflavin-dependent oxidoreductase (nitroreductase family)
MAKVSDWNRRIIEEFHANEGQVGGAFQGVPILLLHHTGARSRLERVNPLAYQQVGDAFAVFASKGGAPTNPDWYHNLLANPRAKVEVGTETFEVVAHEAEDAEREGIWEEQKRRVPGFADYERRTSRRIPVMVLEPVEAGS